MTFYKKLWQRKMDDINIGAEFIMFLVLDGGRSGLMVSGLVSRSSSPSLSPGRGCCVVFLGKMLFTVECFCQRTVG